MNKEKILAYLNIDLKRPIDKFMMKFFTWFHVVSIVFIFGGGGILQLIHFSWFNIIAFVFCVLSSVFLFLTIRFCKKHVYEWLHSLFAVICSVFVLFYGWFVFSKGELAEFGYPRFGWIHIAVLFASLILSGYIMLKFYRAFKITMNNTIEEAQAILQMQNKNAIWPPIALAGSPMLLVRLFSGPFSTMDLGAGFALWVLMCMWLILGFMLLPKVIVILKYKVYLY